VPALKFNFTYVTPKMATQELTFAICVGENNGGKIISCPTSKRRNNL